MKRRPELPTHEIARVTVTNVVPVRFKKIEELLRAGQKQRCIEVEYVFQHKTKRRKATLALHVKIRFKFKHALQGHVLELRKHHLAHPQHEMRAYEVFERNRACLRYDPDATLPQNVPLPPVCVVHTKSQVLKQVLQELSSKVTDDSPWKNVIIGNGL